MCQGIPRYILMIETHKVMEELNSLLDKLENSGDVELRLTGQSGRWRFYGLGGKLFYVSSDLAAVRRFHRAARCYRLSWQWSVDPAWPSLPQSWEMPLIEQAIADNELSPIQIKLILRMILQEALFEVLCEPTPESTPESTLEPTWHPLELETSFTYNAAALSMPEVRRILHKVQQLHSTWQAGGLGDVRLSHTPTLQPGQEDPDMLPLPLHYLNGSTDLWDILQNYEASPLKLAELLKPLSEKGIIEFSPLADLSLSDQGKALETPAADIPANDPAEEAMPVPGDTLVTSFTNDVASRPTGQFSHSPSANTQSATAMSSVTAVASTTARPVSEAAPAPADLFVPQGADQSALIACIDDSPVLTQTLKKILGSAGYRTLSIPEPMRGFAQLIEHRPDLILLDLMLPNADGYSICKFLRDTPAFEKTPILILTGQDSNLDRLRARLAGATEFLAKPPKPASLLKLIRTYLDGSAEEG